MRFLRRTGALMMAFVTGACMLTGCGGDRHSADPLDIRKVTYVSYAGDIERVVVYVLTPDLKIREYDITPDSGDNCDYLEGELPSEDRYTMKEYDMEESDWNNIVLVFTRVNILELDEKIPASEGDDIGSTYIRVETDDAINETGGYGAGYNDDSVSRRYRSAKEALENAIFKI